MTGHVFNAEPVRIPDFTRPVQVCAKCHVIRLRFKSSFQYYGKEHMGAGLHDCPAPFVACGTSPDLELAIAIVNAALATATVDANEGPAK